MYFTEALQNLMPGDIIYVFANPIQDRHDVSVYLVKRWIDETIQLQKPDGTTVMLSKAPNNMVLVISDSELVDFDYETHEWVFKNAG